MTTAIRAVIRIVRNAEVIEVIVGRYGWQQRAIERAESTPGLDPEVDLETPVLALQDLIIAKLFAGGRADLQDIRELLNNQPEDSVAQVQAAVDQVLENETGLSEVAQLWRDGSWIDND